MKEKPIIFGTWAIPKLLDGTKTQTRRLRGLKRINENPDAWMLLGRYSDGYGDGWRFRRKGIDEEIIIKCSYGGVGDRLWVREAYTMEWYQATSTIFYKADFEGSERYDSKTKAYLDPVFNEWTKCYWKPSIFMPRWASRITLEITGLRVERLQGITSGGYMMQSDVQKEGCPFETDYQTFGTKELKWFQELWDSINAKRGYGWDTNPWVWVIEFKKV